MAKINLSSFLAGRGVSTNRKSMPKPKVSPGPTPPSGQPMKVPRASAQARRVASPNARFNRGTASPTKKVRVRRRRGGGLTTRKGY
jgi:hypothetical protein